MPAPSMLRGSKSTLFNTERSALIGDRARPLIKRSSNPTTDGKSCGKTGAQMSMKTKTLLKQGSSRRLSPTVPAATRTILRRMDKRCLSSHQQMMKVCQHMRKAICKVLVRVMYREQTSLVPAYQISVQELRCQIIYKYMLNGTVVIFDGIVRMLKHREPSFQPPARSFNISPS
jgi:hypothetical protein